MGRVERSDHQRTTEQAVEKGGSNRTNHSPPPSTMCIRVPVIAMAVASVSAFVTPPKAQLAARPPPPPLFRPMPINAIAPQLERKSFDQWWEGSENWDEERWAAEKLAILEESASNEVF